MNWSLALRGEPIEYDQTPDDPSTCRRSLTHQRLASPKYAQLRSLSIQSSPSASEVLAFTQLSGTRSASR